jgi:antitoxin VapB
MFPERHVKLFKNGSNQAVRIPREFELPGEHALMRKEGERLTIEPMPPSRCWLCLPPWHRSTKISRPLTIHIRNPSSFDALSA